MGYIKTQRFDRKFSFCPRHPRPLQSDRRNQPFCGWFLEANLGPRCRFSSFFPNRLPSISQWSGNVDEPYFFGALFPHCEAQGRRFGKNEEKRHLGPKFASRNHPKTGWFLRSKWAEKRIMQKAYHEYNLVPRIHFPFLNRMTVLVNKMMFSVLTFILAFVPRRLNTSL